MFKPEAWMFGALLALAGGITDWRTRRIPNWLTVPGLALGIAVNSATMGWSGLKLALLGAGTGLAILLPFVVVRSLGAGDWKLAGAIGAWLGPGRLLGVLFVTILVAGAMALVLVVVKKRVGQTLRNLWRLVAALFTLHLPGNDLSLDDPHALKVPFGVAMALATVFYTALEVWGRR